MAKLMSGGNVPRIALWIISELKSNDYLKTDGQNCCALLLGLRNEYCLQAGITAGGAMSMLVSFLRRGKRIDDAVDETIDFLESARAKRSDGDRDAAETVAALKHAKYATSANELGQGWGAEEALAICVHCALKHSDDSRSGVLEAVNIDGDSDSTGAITGNLLGAAKGVAGIQEEWVTNLRERRIVETVAWDLLAEIETDEDDYVFESWWNKYPGY